jgi:hypothetical protein
MAIVKASDSEWRKEDEKGYFRKCRIPHKRKKYA